MSVDSCETCYWHFGPDSPWFLAPTGSGGHSTLLLSTHLLLSLCVVSEHLIAVSSQNHQNRKEGFNTWTQDYRLRSAARFWGNGTKSCEGHSDPKQSFHLPEESLVSSLHHSVNFHPSSPTHAFTVASLTLPRWALTGFVSVQPDSCSSFTSPDGDSQVTGWEFLIFRSLLIDPHWVKWLLVQSDSG